MGGQGASEEQGSDLGRLLGPHTAGVPTARSELGVVRDYRDHSTKGPRSQEGIPQKKPLATTKTQAAASLDVRMGVLSSLTLQWNSSLGNR